MNRKWTSLLVVLTLIIISACSGGKNGETASPSASSSESAPASSAAASETTPPADPFGKYPELVEFTTIRPTSNNPQFPAGESYEENAYNKFMEEKLNVKPKFVWMAPQDGNAYKQKLDLAIAGNDIPDVFQIVGTSLTDVQLTVKRLVDADMIEDLTSVFDAYASPQLKEAYASNDNRALDLYKIDNKLYAIPTQTSIEDFNFVWIREDWRKKLNLPEPKTLEDVVAIAQAFKDKDPAGGGKTVPIAMQMQNEPAGLFGPGYLFDQFEAFPRLFYKDASGNLVYGGVQPQIKEGLKVLSQLYQDGLLEKDFALKDTGQLQELLASGRAGIVGQAWWGVWYPLFMTVQNNPDADWKPYFIPAKSNGKMNIGAFTPSSTVLVVKKGFKYPELPIKWTNVFNANRDGEFFLKTQQELYKDAVEKMPIWSSLTVGPTDDIVRQAKDIVAAVNGEKDPASLPYKNQDAYNNISKYINELKDLPQSPNKNMLQWQNTRSWYDAMGALGKAEINMVYSAYDGRTPTMEKKMTTLNDLQMKAYHQIVMGKSADIDAQFDKFVSDWLSQGGQDILNEINEALGK